MTKQEKSDNGPKLVVEAIERYLADMLDADTGVLDWKKVSGLIKESRAKEDLSAEQCEQIWCQLTGEGPSQPSKKRKASSDADEDSYGVVHITLGSVGDMADNGVGPDDVKGKAGVTGTQRVRIQEPRQFYLPRNHDMMSFTAFKKIPQASAQTSATDSRLLGVSYGAALCSSRHARPLLHKLSHHGKAPGSGEGRAKLGKQR